MKNLLDKLKNIAAVIGILAVLFGFTSKGYELYADIMSRVFRSVEIKRESEEFHTRISVKQFDRGRLFDSIKKSNDDKWKRQQEKRMEELERLLRLNVRLSDKAAKSTDTLNRNLEHTLEHVDQ